MSIIDELNKNKLVYQYLRKIDKYNTDHFGKVGITYAARVEIEKYLRLIVNNKLDYLLTDSFLDCSIFYGDYSAVEALKRLSGDKYDLISSLTDYYDAIFFEFFYRMPEYLYSYAVLLDDELKEIIQNIVKKLDQYKKISMREQYGYDDILKIIYIVFSIYTINHRKDDIYEMCDVFLNDVDRVIDMLIINNVYGDLYKLPSFKQRERLIDFVSNKLNNHHNKLIK